MSVNSVGYSLSQAGMPHAARERVTIEKFAISILALTFLLSYLQFCFERSDVIRLVPIATLIFGTFAYLLLCGKETRRVVLATTCRPISWTIIIGACFPALVSSLYRHGGNAFAYGLVMIVVLFAVRVLLSGVGFDGLLTAFFYGATVGLLIVVGVTFTDLLESVGTTRYAPLEFDPNRIAFFAVTAIPAQLWFAFTRRRYYVLAVTALATFVISVASSRGSIGGLLLGSAVTAALWLVRAYRFKEFKLSRPLIIGVLGASCLCAGAVAFQGAAAAKAGQFLWDKLAFDNQARGVDSGFTGRTSGWGELVNIWPKTLWLTGNGFHTSDEDFDFSVDNGYLAGLYELGLLSMIVVSAKYLFVLWFMAKTYITQRANATTCLVVFFTCVIFFANAFVHRVFLSCGEQASILLLFVFMALPNDFIESLQPDLPASWAVTQ